MEAKDLIRRFESARSVRYNWEHHWQEVADLVLPTREFTYDYAPGEKRRNRIYSDVAPEAAETLAAALSGMLTNTSVRWFSLIATDDRMKESQAVSKYLYDTTQIMLDYFDSQQSGFSIASHEMYLDIVTFGTGVMQVMDSGNGIRFQAKPLSSVMAFTLKPSVVSKRASMTDQSTGMRATDRLSLSMPSSSVWIGMSSNWTPPTCPTPRTTLRRAMLT